MYSAILNIPKSMTYEEYVAILPSLLHVDTDLYELDVINGVEEPNPCRLEYKFYIDYVLLKTDLFYEYKQMEERIEVGL